MVLETRYFALSDEHSAQEWGSIVATLAIGEKVGQRVVEQTYLDTFDWALRRADLNLVYEEDEETRLRIITDNTDGKRPSPQVIENIPVWPKDIAPGKMQNLLSKLVGLRALLPLTRIKSEEIIVHVKDKKGRVRLQLAVECNFQQINAQGKLSTLGCRLRIERAKGQDKEFARTLPRFEGLKRTTQQAFFDQIMQNVQKTPLDYSGKLSITLDKSMRADEALKAILLDQLNQIEANIEGTLANTDTEFLHDMRVAVRRSRSAISRIKDVVPPSVIDRFADELAWIGSITTPMRDLDVYMLDYPKYRDQLSVEQQENLKPLYDFLVQQHGIAQRQLIADLKSARFRDFLVKWRAFLQRPVPQRPSAPLALEEIGDIADSRIWKTYRRVVKEGSVITDDTPAEALHDMRKTCKKLRYLLEFFASLYPSDQVSTLVKILKGLQENLGDFQDLDVQAEKLHEYSTQMMAAGENRPQVFMSMGVLVEGFMVRKAQVRTEFSERFARFAAKPVEEAFRKLTAQGQKNKKIALSAHVED